MILHTPGGDIAATESIVKYLWVMFDKNIRVIVPQLGGVPAQGVIDEFQMAVESIRAEPASAPLWQQIVSRYHPSFLLECTQAIKWSRDMVERWLIENMFANNADQLAAQKVVAYLGDHATTATHSRHLPLSKCEEIGLKIERLEDDSKLQDLVLTVHHAYMHTFSMSPALKITENHQGVATVLMGMQQQVVRGGPAGAAPRGVEVPAPAVAPAERSQRNE